MSLNSYPSTTTTTTTTSTTTATATTKKLSNNYMLHHQMPPATTNAGTDAWLWKILQKEKNREMIAKLEDNLHNFISDSNQSSLFFPPRNAFHRRVCYAVARRYGLEHRLESTNKTSTNESTATTKNEEEIEEEQHNARQKQQILSNDSEIIRLVLIKTPFSAPPRNRLDQFANGPQPPSLPPSSSSPSTSSHPSVSLPSLGSANYFQNTINSNTSSPSSSTDSNNFMISNGNTNNPSFSADSINLNDSNNNNSNFNNNFNSDDISQSNSSSSASLSAASRPATFLRRPRTADGKLKRTANGSHALSNSNTSALPIKNFSEEDYQKMRARIFKNPVVNNDGTSTDCIANHNVNDNGDTTSGVEAVGGNDQESCFAKSPNVAKGPVEGSRGFERRRIRRNNQCNNNNSNNNNNSSSNNSSNNNHNMHSNKHNVNNASSTSVTQHHNNVGGRSIRRINSSNEFINSDKQINSSNNNNINNNTGRVVLCNSRNKRNANDNSDSTSRSSRDGTRHGNGVSLNDQGNEARNGRNNNNKNSKHGNSSSGNDNGVFHLATNGKKYASESNFGDLGDPDFDRSYVKWARREPVSANITSSVRPINNQDNNNHKNDNNRNTIGLPIYPSTHMLYQPYGTAPSPGNATPTTTQSIGHHPLPQSYSPLHVHPSHPIHPHMLPHSHAYATPHYSSVSHPHPALSHPLSQQQSSQSQPSNQSRTSNHLQHLQQHPLAVAASAAAALQGSGVGVPPPVGSSLGMSSASALTPIPSNTSYHPNSGPMVSQAPSVNYGNNAMSSGNLREFSNNNNLISYDNDNQRLISSNDFKNCTNNNSKNDALMREMISMTSQVNVNSVISSSSKPLQYPAGLGNQDMSNYQTLSTQKPSTDNQVSASSDAHVPSSISSLKADNCKLDLQQPEITLNQIGSQNVLNGEAGIVSNERHVEDGRLEENNGKLDEERPVDAQPKDEKENNEIEHALADQQLSINRKETVEDPSFHEEANENSYHTRALPWAPETIPVTVPSPPATPAYGLDSTVDFPPLH